jgi:hypothetical protein
MECVYCAVRTESSLTLQVKKDKIPTPLAHVTSLLVPAIRTVLTLGCQF